MMRFHLASLKFTASSVFLPPLTVTTPLELSIVTCIFAEYHADPACCPATTWTNGTPTRRRARDQWCRRLAGSPGKNNEKSRTPDTGELSATVRGGEKASSLCRTEYRRFQQVIRSPDYEKCACNLLTLILGIAKNNVTKQFPRSVKNF